MIDMNKAKRTPEDIIQELDRESLEFSRLLLVLLCPDEPKDEAIFFIDRASPDRLALLTNAIAHRAGVIGFLGMIDVGGTVAIYHKVLREYLSMWEGGEMLLKIAANQAAAQLGLGPYVVSPGWVN